MCITMTGENGRTESLIDKRDFDANRPLLGDVDADGHGTRHGPSRSRSHSRRSRPSISADDDDDGDGSNGLLSDVVEGIVERDRRRMEREVVRVCSFTWGVITW